MRTHWWIENKIHWIRDVPFGEDTHHTYLGTVAHTMAALRNLTVALIRLAGHPGQTRHGTSPRQQATHPGTAQRIPSMIN